MSRRRNSLSSPPVVAGVFIVLAVLVVVNVRTFAPRRPRHRAPAAAEADAGVRVQAHPSLPLDIEDVMRQAGRLADGFGEPVSGPRPAVERDPFTTASLLPLASAPAAPRPARPARPGDPVCSAVMLGAGAPAALIDGRLCRVGDTVGRLAIVSIDARGVVLGGEKELFLPVGIASAGEGANMVVNGVASGDRLGSTSLVEYADSERN